MASNKKFQGSLPFVLVALGSLVVIVGLLASLFFLLREATESQLAAAGNAAQVVNLMSVVVAAGALTYASLQVTIARDIQAETLAQQAYSSYLLKAFEHPKLAMGLQKDIEAAGPEKYKWFISYMLNACEGIILGLPGDTLWESCAKTQLRYHKNYLTKDPWFIANYEHLYDPRFVKLIQAVQTEKNVS